MRKIPWGRTIAAVLLLVLGSLGMYGALAWSTDQSYTVSIGYAFGTNWTVWVPAPVQAMTVSSIQGATLNAPVATAHGTLLNLTGSGNATITFSWSGESYGPDPLSLGLPSGLTATNDTVAWAWVSLSSHTQIPQVAGAVHWDANGFQGYATGLGISYGGFVNAGWNAFKVDAASAKVRVGEPPLPWVAGFLIAAGAGLLGWTMYRRKHPAKFA